MRIRVSSPDHVEDLIGFLLDRGCIVERVAESELEAASLSSLRAEYAHLDLELYLAAWAAAHPGVAAELL